MPTATATLVSPLGVPVQIPFRVARTSDVPLRLLELQREFGARGFHTQMPAGGYRLPLANAPTFDWRLIGARIGKRTFPKTGGGTEIKHGVWHAGQFYVRREGEEVDKPSAQLPEAVWYSRVTNGNEPPGTVVEESGRTRYVRLITFRGDGRRIDQYARPDIEPGIVTPRENAAARTA